VVAVRDLAAARASYARLLARGPSFEGERPGEGTATGRFRLDNASLELLAPAGSRSAGAELEGWLDAHGEGVAALAFGTSDAERCREALAARGLEPGPVRKGLARDAGSGAFREWRGVDLPLECTRGVRLLAVEQRSPAGLVPLLPPAGDASAAPHALDHVVVRSADLDASRALYGEGLGLRLALDRSFEASGFRALFFRVAGVTIEVTGPLAPAADSAVPDSLYGLAFAVADVAAARERLAQGGFDVSPVRAGRKPGTRVCTVRSGTCGVATLLVGPDSPAGGATF
jgi:catechol 2,3-dioxygenase-like lactoylglutathione lyase family enzyme